MRKINKFQITQLFGGVVDLHPNLAKYRREQNKETRAFTRFLANCQCSLHREGIRVYHPVHIR